MPLVKSRGLELFMFTKFCATVSKICLVLAVIGLIAVILCVQWQVIGRYVLNDTPTWAEALAMLIVLFVTAFGLAVGVRDAGHIGLESLVVLLPEKWQHRIEVLIHALVGLFGFLMVQGGWLWASAKWDEKKTHAARARRYRLCTGDHCGCFDFAFLD
jgi:TRAP-type transport system small permease protein